MPSLDIRKTVRTERQVKLRVVSEAVRIRQVVLYYLKELGGVKPQTEAGRDSCLVGHQNADRNYQM